MISSSISSIGVRLTNSETTTIRPHISFEINYPKIAYCQISEVLKYEKANKMQLSAPKMALLSCSPRQNCNSLLKLDNREAADLVFKEEFSNRKCLKCD
jgi:hypothetical protein